MASNGNGATGHVEPSALDVLAEQVADQLAQAKLARDDVRAQLRQSEALVARLQQAATALAGPAPKTRDPNRDRSTDAKIQAVSDEVSQLVESAMASMGRPATVHEISQTIPTRSESVVRYAVYKLRDEDRVRIVGTGGIRGAKQYDLMPDVAAEHGVEV